MAVLWLNLSLYTHTHTHLSVCVYRLTHTHLSETVFSGLAPSVKNTRLTVIGPCGGSREGAAVKAEQGVVTFRGCLMTSWFFVCVCVCCGATAACCLLNGFMIYIFLKKK